MIEYQNTGPGYENVRITFICVIELSRTDLWPTVFAFPHSFKTFFCFQQLVSDLGFYLFVLPHCLSGQLESGLNLLFSLPCSYLSAFLTISSFSNFSIVLQGALWFFEKPLTLVQDLVPTVQLWFSWPWTSAPTAGFFPEVLKVL